MYYTSVLLLVSSSTLSQSVLARWMAPVLIWSRMPARVDCSISRRVELEMQNMAYGVRISEGKAMN